MNIQHISFEDLKRSILVKDARAFEVLKPERSTIDSHKHRRRSFSQEEIAAHLYSENAVEGKRSEYFYRFVKESQKRGYSLDDATALANEHSDSPVMEKYAGRIDAEVQRVWEKTSLLPISVQQNAYLLSPFKSGSDVEIALEALREMLDQYNSAIVFTEGEFYRFDGHRWITISTADELRRHLHRYDGMRYGDKGIIRLGKPRIDSIIHEMGAIVACEGFFDEPRVGINCANGFLDLSTGTPVLISHAPEHRQRHVIDTKWHEAVDWRWAGPLLCKLLDGCFQDDPDKEAKITLLSEMHGAALLGAATKLRQPKCIVCHGAKANNGKSENLRVLGALLPQDAVSAIPPSKFSDDRYLIGLVGKTLNIAAELGTANAIGSDCLKAVITGDLISARQLYKPAVYFRPKALNVFACNNLPGFSGGIDPGVRRRLIVINFDRVIPEQEQIPNIGARIATEEREALLAFGVEGACRLLKQGAFTEPQSSRDALLEWMFSADPVIAWLAERTDHAEGNRIITRDAYSDFKIWASQEGLDTKRLPAPNTFVARILAHDGRISKHRNHTIGRFLLNLRVRASSATDGGFYA